MAVKFAPAPQYCIKAEKFQRQNFIGIDAKTARFCRFMIKK